PAEQSVVAKGSSDLQSVQKAMAECDQEATRNPTSLYLLIIPVLPDTDLTKTTSPEGETYQTYFLMTSKAMLAGLSGTTYVINRRPFVFSISDSTNGQSKSWNMVSGVTKLKHDGPEQFREFRVGFDPTGRGYGLVWSKPYTRQPNVCYWINVRFRVE